MATDARFCTSCGTPLDAPDEAPSPPVADASGAERKIISAMFCDLAGFTAHTARADPEDVRARLGTFHATIRRDVERFGGMVEKLLGDGVFAVFGASVAHEDDPVRAVQAALRILDSIAAVNEAQDLGLEVRIAVTTGEAIIQVTEKTDHEGIIGDVVNTASRLEAVAEPGTVVVDERTYRASRQAIEFTALDPVTVKGKTDPIAIWRAHRSKSRFGVAVDDAPDVPFVGRDSELRLLLEALERTRERSSPQTVIVTGEPGVGKSRLVRAFREAVDAQDDVVYWRQGRCLPYGEGVSFWAIGEVVKAHAGILESEPPRSAVPKLEDAVRAVIDDEEQARWITARLMPLIGRSSPAEVGAERDEVFAAWTRFFEALSAKHPLVLVIEDLHWADDSVLDFLGHLTEWATDSPILLIVTARPELWTDRPDFGAGGRDTLKVGLDPLTTHEAIELISTLAPRPVMSAELQQALLEKSGGNPLYVTEYMRLADEQDWFAKAERGEDLPLPDSVQAIISARIDLLDGSFKDLLQTAAVIGRVFWAGALSFVDAQSADAVRSKLRDLTRAEMIRPVRRSSMQGHDEYTFSHVLIRDVAYSRLTREDRARLHLATANWLEAVTGDAADDVAELVAHHLSTAYELSHSDDPAMKRRILRFLMTAIERASRLDAKAAQTLAERATKFASDDRELGRALVELASVMVLSPAAASTFEEAIAAFQRAGDLAGEVEATRGLGRVIWYIGDGDATDAVGARLLELADRLEPSKPVAQALIAVASSRQLRGQEEEALDLVQRGLAIARADGDTEMFAEGLVIQGSALLQMGDESGLADLEEALAIQLDRNDARAALRTYNNLATFLNDSGSPIEAAAVIGDAIALGEQRGMVSEVDWSSNTLAEPLFVLGDWARLRHIVDERLNLARVSDTQVGLAFRLWDSTLRYLQGSPKAAWEGCRPLLEDVRKIQDPQGVVPVLSHAVAMSYEAGDHVSARRLVDELADVGRRHPFFLTLHAAWCYRAIVNLEMFDVLDSMSRARTAFPWPAMKMRLAQAALMAARDEHQGAVDHLDPLIDEADRREERLIAMMARLDSAASLLALGEGARAEELLDRATEAAEHMGAGLYLDRIAALRFRPPAATAT